MTAGPQEIALLLVDEVTNVVEDGEVVVEAVAVVMLDVDDQTDVSVGDDPPLREMEVKLAALLSLYARSEVASSAAVDIDVMAPSSLILHFSPVGWHTGRAASILQRLIDLGQWCLLQKMYTEIAGGRQSVGW